MFRSRRILMPVVILAVGGALAWWAASRDARMMREIESTVTALCHEAARGEDLSNRLPVQHSAIAREIDQRMQLGCQGLRHSPELLEVLVSPGKMPDAARAEATHLAIIRVGRVDMLGLGFKRQNGRPVIVGYWTPPPP